MFCELLTDFLALTDTLKAAIRFHKAVGDAIFRELNFLESLEAHRQLDFVLLLILLSFPNHQRKAMLLVRKKILHGWLSLSLMEKTLGMHADAFKTYESLLVLKHTY